MRNGTRVGIALITAITAITNRFDKDLSRSFARGCHRLGVEALAQQHIDHPRFPTTGTHAVATYRSTGA